MEVILDLRFLLVEASLVDFVPFGADEENLDGLLAVHEADEEHLGLLDGLLAAHERDEEHLDGLLVRSRRSAP